MPAMVAGRGAAYERVLGLESTSLATARLGSSDWTAGDAAFSQDALAPCLEEGALSDCSDAASISAAARRRQEARFQNSGKRTAAAVLCLLGAVTFAYVLTRGTGGSAPTRSRLGSPPTAADFVAKVASQSSGPAPAGWVNHKGLNCYSDGNGEQVVKDRSYEGKRLSLKECRETCAKIEGCESVLVLHGQDPGPCWMRKGVDVASCEEKSPWDLWSFAPNSTRKAVAKKTATSTTTKKTTTTVTKLTTTTTVPTTTSTKLTTTTKTSLPTTTTEEKKASTTKERKIVKDAAEEDKAENKKSDTSKGSKQKVEKDEKEDEDAKEKEGMKKKSDEADDDVVVLVVPDDKEGHSTKKDKVGTKEESGEKDEKPAGRSASADEKDEAGESDAKEKKDAKEERADEGAEEKDKKEEQEGHSKREGDKKDAKEERAEEGAKEKKEEQEGHKAKKAGGREHGHGTADAAEEPAERRPSEGREEHEHASVQKDSAVEGDSKGEHREKGQQAGGHDGHHEGSGKAAAEPTTSSTTTTRKTAPSTTTTAATTSTTAPSTSTSTSTATTTVTTTSTRTATTMTTTTVTTTTAFDGYPCKPTGCPSCVARKRMPPALVIPTYERDLCKLKYTAKSISVHDPNHFLGDVYIMWVSKQGMWNYQGQLDEIKGLIASTHRVHLIDYSPQVASFPKGGWFAQQVIKLKIASVVTSDFYVVLDSKNTLIQDVKADTFFTDCNQAKIFGEYTFDKIPEPHKGWYAKSAQLMNIPPINSGIWPASITPMTMHRQTVLDMLGSVFENANPNPLCNGQLCQLLEQGATEFTMYLTYAHGKTDLKCTHAIERIDWAHELATSLWRGLPQNADICKDIAWGGRSSLMFGAQARAIQGMPWDQQNEIKPHIVKIYKDAKLYKDEDSTVDALIQCIG